MLLPVSYRTAKLLNVGFCGDSNTLRIVKYS